MVKGDLIVPTSSRIMTRSQTKKNPDRFTTLSASVKIIKVLVEELSSASNSQGAATAAALADFAEGEGDNDGWEDVPSALDLANSATKADLMAFAEGRGSFVRDKDDEIQKYLSKFFMKVAKEAPENFREVFNALTDEEKKKLQLLEQ
jgi:hypothetical protein